MDILSAAKARWGIDLHKSTRNEYVGPCPFCGQGHDRFHVWLDKSNYWCRVCGKKGFIDENEPKPTDPAEARLRRLEREQAAAKREREELHRRMTALERMAKSTDHIAYHQALNAGAYEYWFSEGVTDESIERYKLGYCHRCPTAKNGSPSYTIPVVNGGELLNIRHRLIDDNAKGGRYRPHMAGLGVQLFNADVLASGADSVLLTEGAKKAIVAGQFGFEVAAIMGKRAFKPEWLAAFEQVPTVYVALDPDAMESAYRLGAMFNGRARVAHLPCKLDDAFVKYGATASDIRDFMRLARPAGRVQ
jgi:DNA primase